MSKNTDELAEDFKNLFIKNFVKNKKDSYWNLNLDTNLVCDLFSVVLDYQYRLAEEQMPSVEKFFEEKLEKDPDLLFSCLSFISTSGDWVPSLLVDGFSFEEVVEEVVKEVKRIEMVDQSV